jgi:signal transduction histidine kinase
MDMSPNHAVLAALHEINASVLVAGESNVGPLQVVARRARDLTDADVATVAVPDDGSDMLVLRVVEGIHRDELLGVMFPASASISGEVLSTGQVVMLSAAATDPRVHQPVVELGTIGPVILAPLRTSTEPIGTLAVGRTRVRPPFTVADRDVVAAFASQASVVIHLAGKEQALLTLTDAQRRERVGRELHDTVIQRLYGMAVSFQAILATAPPESASLIEQLIADLDSTISEIRSTVFEAPE